MNEDHKGYGYWLQALEPGLGEADVNDLPSQLLTTSGYRQSLDASEQLRTLADACRHLVFTKSGSLAEHEALQQLGWVMATVVDGNLTPNHVARKLVDYRPIRPGFLSRLRTAQDVLLTGRFRLFLRKIGDNL